MINDGLPAQKLFNTLCRQTIIDQKSIKISAFGFPYGIKCFACVVVYPYNVQKYSQDTYD